MSRGSAFLPGTARSGALSFAVFVALLAGLTIAAIFLADGDIAISVVPVLLIGALLAIFRLPLRYPVLVATFLALTLENPAEAPAARAWSSPLYPLGRVLFVHLKNTVPSQGWLILSGLDLLLVALLALGLIRWISGSRVDGPRDGAGGSPLRTFAVVCLCGAAWIWIWGLARGGADVGNSFWQVQRAATLPTWYFLFDLALRRRADWVAVGKIIIAAACLKAALAIYIRKTVTPPPGMGSLPYVTTHPDSMLFATAFCLVIVILLHGEGRMLALALPLLLLGMRANNRRVVWMEILAGLAVLYAVSPWTRAKRAVTRVVAVAAPVLAIYAAVGWSSGSGVFRPVQTIRSMVDSKVDASTEWRDGENYNLVFTFRQNPLLGTGYGHGYEEVVKLDDISEFYELYRFVPHNSILGLWVYGGLVGFAALWALLAVAVFLGARAARHATAPVDRISAVGAVVAIVVYLVHCYGDMGLGTWTSAFTAGPALAIAGRLAVATGAWPGRA